MTHFRQLSHWSERTAASPQKTNVILFVTLKTVVMSKTVVRYWTSVYSYTFWNVFVSLFSLHYLCSRLPVEYQVIEDGSLCVILSTRVSVDGLTSQLKLGTCGRDSREGTRFLTVGRPPTTPPALPQVHDRQFSLPFLQELVIFIKPFKIQW